MVKRSKTIRDRNRSAIAKGQPNCWLCGYEIDYTLPYLHPLEFTVDHRIPLDLGGPDTLDNCAPAHRRCNRAKSNRLVAPIVRRSNTLA